MSTIGRREFVKAAAMAAAATGVGRAAAAETKRPNILVIFSDQISADAMSCRIGNKYIHTPNLDALSARSMRFSRAYAANPLCVPARTAMFTGRYPVETKAQSNDKFLLDPAVFPCIGKLFHDSGYETAYFGKWHLPYPEKQEAVGIHGFERMRSEVVDVETAEHVVGYMEEKRERPFFAVASFLNPHNICEWARGETKLNQGEIGPPPPADQCPPLRANHENPKDEPEIMTLMRESYHNSPLFPVGNFDDAKWRQYLWAYYRLIEKMDALLGKVLAAVDDNTVVLFLADHGDCQGAHHFNQKTVLYEEALVVPFLLSGKGVKPGMSDALVSTGVDFLPTLCGFAGIAVPPQIRGGRWLRLRVEARRRVIASMS